MCYPKPGPRCSAHAAAAFSKAHQKVLSAFMNNVRGPELDKLIKARNKAKTEYSITPAGIHELEESYNRNPTQWGKDELDLLKKTRDKRLALVKNQVSKKHQVRGSRRYEQTPWLRNGDRPEEMHYNHPNLLASIRDSEKWSYSLTDKEVAAIAWYSQSGFGEVNGHLSNPDYKSDEGLSKEKLNETVELMDSAFSKYSPSTGVTVYRRHLNWTGNYSYDDLTSEQIQEKFQPGTIFEPGFYMSTSLNPDNLPTSESAVIAFEIRTKTAVPVTSVSSQGPREYEFITPRNAKFKVVSNNVKVQRENNLGLSKEPKNVNVVVIQLEEI